VVTTAVAVLQVLVVLVVLGVVVTVTLLGEAEKLLVQPTQAGVAALHTIILMVCQAVQVL
jgi:hypothetical protein